MIPKTVQPWIEEALAPFKNEIETLLTGEFPNLGFGEDGGELLVEDVVPADVLLSGNAEVEYIDGNVARISSSADVTFSAEVTYKAEDGSGSKTQFLESEKAIVLVTIRAKLNEEIQSIDELVEVACSPGAAGFVEIHVPK